MLTDTQLPKPDRSGWIRSMLPPVVVAVLLIVAVTKWFQWRPSFLEPGQNDVYIVRNGVWQTLPELPGEPEKLQVSAGGAVWALLWHRGVGSELARLDGAAWRTFQSADFSTRGLDASAGFVLDGEDVWAATDEGVLHWDGQKWKCYREAMAGATASSIAAAHGKVWVIDDKGNLSHFDGSQWTKGKAALPGAQWSDDPDENDAEFARTDDGTLWIVRNGVWRLDGSAWSAVKPGGEDFKDGTLIGSGGKSIWLWNGGYLESVGPDGTLRKFAPAEMGFLPGEAIEDVAESAGRTDVATSRGILELDGGAWRRLAPPGNGVQAVVGLRAGKSGELFAIGNTPHLVARRLRFLIRSVPLMLMLGLLGMIVWMVRRYKRYQLREHQRLQQAVTHATGAAPEEFAQDERLLTKQSSWWSATVTVGVIVGGMMGYWITRMFWPAVPPWMFLVIALLLHVVVTLGQTLVRRTPKPWDPIEPGGPGFDWGPTRRALPASLVVFLLMNMGEFPRWMGSPVLWLLYGFLAVVWYKALGVKFLIAKIHRADYEGGLRIIRLFYFYNSAGGRAQLQRGQVLLLAGRFGEAEVALRRAMAGLRARVAQALALEALGEALLEQGRYEEAMRSYEAAVHAAPGFRRPYRGMAELTLRRGRDRAQALEYVESIVGPKGPSWNRWTMNGQASDDYWSLKAWALAELGRGQEVGPAAAEAIRKTNRRSRPDLAATYRRLGLAMQALDRQAEAEEYLKKGLEADPHGRWSALTRAALEKRRTYSA